MYVAKVHKGHSTNSSSSHSIILDRVNARRGEDYAVSLADGDISFSWDWFRLESKETKRLYYAAQVYYSLSRTNMPEEFIYDIISNLTGLDRNRFTECLDYRIGEEDSDVVDISIDHQSIWWLPSYAPYQFYKDLRDFILSDDVVIIGGNDNDSPIYDYEYNGEIITDLEKKEFLSKEEAEKLEKLKREYEKIGLNIVNFLKQGTDYSGILTNMFSRRSVVDERGSLVKDGEYWISFDRCTGIKTIFTFNKDAKPYTKSTFPHLVDLNVTDKCKDNCRFCYKSASSDRKEADLDSVKSILLKLMDIGTFEVALGGGEVTEWPYLEEVLNFFGKEKESNESSTNGRLNINITTHSAAWLNKSSLLETVKARVSGIGVSVHNVRDIRLVDSIASKVIGYRWDGTIDYRSFSGGMTVVAQHVFGTLPFDDFIALFNIITSMNIPILLLGYKNIGRGSSFKPIEYTEEQMKILGNAMSNYYGSISVDTTFAAKYENFIKSLDVSDKLYDLEEGKFSCYIDAVSGKMGPSSYCSEDKMVDLPKCMTPDGSRYIGNTIQEFLDIYQKF